MKQVREWDRNEIPKRRIFYNITPRHNPKEYVSFIVAKALTTINDLLHPLVLRHKEQFMFVFYTVCNGDTNKNTLQYYFKENVLYTRTFSLK